MVVLKVVVPFVPSPADGLGFWKEPSMHLASMTSRTTDPSGIFAKLLKAALVWKSAAAENFRAKNPAGFMQF